MDLQGLSKGQFHHDAEEVLGVDEAIRRVDLFITKPGIVVQHLPYGERPLHMTFGDGTEFTRDELEQFIKVYDDFGTPIDWRVGDVAVICNYRFAHGRPEIKLEDGESRRLGVLLGEQFDRIGQRNDKW